MIVDLVGGEGEGVGGDGDGLVVAAGDAELVEAVAELDAVVLGRTVAHGVDGRGGTALVVVAGHAGVGMFVALHHEVYAILLDKVVEKPALNEVVVALDGEQRMMEHHDFPAGGAGLQLALKPVALRLEIEEFAVAVQEEELGGAVAHGVDHVVVDLRVEEVGKHQWEATLQAHDDSLQIVVVARYAEQRQVLRHAVDVAEGLGPVLVGGTLGQVATAHQKFCLGMPCEGFAQIAVGLSTEGVLHVAYVEIGDG